MKVFAGSYTKMIDANFGGTGEGVYCLDFDEVNGNLSLISKLKIENPSYLCVLNNILYTFNEVVQDETPFLYAYKIESNGELVLLNRLPINGDTPCHITFSTRYKCLFISCYGSGNVLIVSLNGDGSLGSAIRDLRHSGHSVNQERQNGPHAHCALVIDETDELYVTDLGTDRIYVYKIKELEDSLMIDYSSHIETPVGSGPRHLVAHPSSRYLFVVTELIPCVLMIDLAQKKIVSSITLAVRDDIGSTAAIKMASDTKNLYVSERKGGSIFILSYDVNNACLKLTDEIKTNVTTPRDFLVDKTGNWLIVAGQDSNTISIYKRERSDGGWALNKTLDGIRSISCLI